MGASKVINMGAMSMYEDKINKLTDENKLLRQFISESIMDSNKLLKSENEGLKIKIGNIEGQMKANKENYINTLKNMEFSHQRSKDTMKGQKQSLEYDYSKLDNILANEQFKVKKLSNDKNKLNEKIKVMDGEIITLKEKVMDREKELELLNIIIERLTNVKLDTEQILDDVRNITLEYSDINLDKLINDIGKEKGLMVVDSMDAKELVSIIVANRKYLEKSRAGKVLVRDKDDLIEKINICIDVINNDGRVNKVMSEKYNTSSSSLIQKKNRLEKNGIYDIVKEYMHSDNKLTDSIRDRYNNKYPDLINVLEDLKI